MHRVRLLRAGVPEPQPHDDAAPADRAAARDGPPAGGLAGAMRRCSRSTSTTRSRPAPPTAPAAARARSAIDTGKLVKQLRAAEHAPRAERGRARARARARRTVERAARGGAAARAPPRRGGERRRRARSPAPAAPTVGSELIPAWPRRLPAGPGAAVPARARRGRRRRVLPGLHQPHLRQSRAGSSEPSLPRGDARASPRAPGLPLWIPAGRRRALLRDAVELEGLSAAATS